MEIKWAKWGGVDCTEIVKSKIRGNKLVLRADNNLIGDTKPGVVKYLEIEGKWQGEPFKESIKENSIESRGSSCGVSPGGSSWTGPKNAHGASFNSSSS